VTKSQVVLDRPIKAIGMHEVKIALHPEVAVTVKVNVARSPEEADLQAQGVDVMAQMFERDTAAFTEEFEPGLEPGIPSAAENPGTPEEAEVGTETEEG
jgi:large subunit ribosomal protein L9